MKILYTSDIHASVAHLEALLTAAARHDVAAVIVGGDLIPHNLPGEDILQAQADYLQQTFVPALAEFRKQYPVTIYLDLGNDDFFCSRHCLMPYDGDLLHLIHERRFELTPGVDLMGYMTVPPTPFGRKDWEKPDGAHWPFAPGTDVRRQGVVTRRGRMEPWRLVWPSKDTIERDLQRLSTQVRGPFVFVSHSPPFDTDLDVIYTGQHVGSLSVRRFIAHWARQGNLVASLHGHIHESYQRSGQRVTVIDNCGVPSINPGQQMGPGARLQFALLEIDGSTGCLTDLHFPENS